MREFLVHCRAEKLIDNSLLGKNKIGLPPLYIKLVLFKLFTITVDKNDGCFSYLCQDSPVLAIENLNGAVFDDLQIRQLLRKPEFENSTNEV